MVYTTLSLEINEAIATITLSRPEKRNAISSAMLDELPAALAETEKSPARVTILTGAGKAFCSGMDLEGLKALAENSPEQNLEDSNRMMRMFHSLYTFPKPLIAAVNGAAIAGGCILSTLCDFTLAVPGTKFGYTEVRIGFIPALVSVFLTRQIGEKRTRDLLLTGRIFESKEAHQMGLVTEIVSPERLMERAQELAATLLENSPTSLIRTKALLYENSKEVLEKELEAAVRENANIRSTKDFQEGLASFLEKRKPVWRGE